MLTRFHYYMLTFQKFLQIFKHVYFKTQAEAWQRLDERYADRVGVIRSVLRNLSDRPQAEQKRAGSTTSSSSWTAKSGTSWTTSRPATASRLTLSWSASW